MMKTLVVACLTGLSAVPLSLQEEMSQAELESRTDRIRAEIVALREKEFLRPVKVAIAGEKEFQEYLQARMERSTTPEEIAADEVVAKLLGLIPADMNYLDTQLELLEDQVGGFYDPGSETFYLMSRFSGDIAKVILAHELTHALDDQHYDIDGTADALAGNADEELAFHAVVEGSGSAVMNIWTIRHMFELDPAALVDAGNTGAEALEDAPPFLWKPLITVYGKGNAFLNRTSNVMTGSMTLPELDDFHRAFSDPPRSSEQILHPEKYWDAEARDDPVPVELGLEHLPDGWEVLREDTLGELGWGMVVEPLKKRKGLGGQLALLQVRYTYEASEGWGGDRYALIAKGDARILTCETTWDTERDRGEFLAGLMDLREHLDGAVAETARVLGTDESGRVIVERAAGKTIGVRAWVGVSEEEVRDVLRGVPIRLP